MSSANDEKIFEIANVHNTVIKHFSLELCKTKSWIMNDFPVGVGCDEIMPSLLSDESFDNLYRKLYRPSLG